MPPGNEIISLEHKVRGRKTFGPRNIFWMERERMKEGISKRISKTRSEQTKQ
jgi:hypothetical protein